jgi:hypothetical protein
LTTAALVASVTASLRLGTFLYLAVTSARISRARVSDCGSSVDEVDEG